MIAWFGAFWTRFPGLPSPSKQGNCDERLAKAAPSRNPILAKWGFATAGWLGASWTRFPGLPSPSKQGNCDEQLEKGLLDLFSRFTEPQYRKPRRAARKGSPRQKTFFWRNRVLRRLVGSRPPVESPNTGFWNHLQSQTLVTHTT